MPLITIIGPPSSGKSTFSAYLQQFMFEKTSSLYTISKPIENAPLDQKLISPILISNHSVTNDLNSIYDTSENERKGRGKLKSRLMNHISKKKIVINDGLNEIKGWRFELFRYCQEVQTKNIVVELKRTLKECLENNQKERFIPKTIDVFDPNGSLSTTIEERVKNQDVSNDKEINQENNQNITESNDLSHHKHIVQVKWNEDLLAQIYGRMEWADGKNRWDKPLYALDAWKEDDIDTRNEQFRQLAEEIWNELHDISESKSMRKPSNIVKEISDTNTLFEMEKITNQVVKQIMDLQNTSAPGSAVQVCSESKEKFIYPKRGLSLMQLRKLRQQFIKMQQNSGIKDIQSIYSLFIIYLNNTYTQ